MAVLLALSMLLGLLTACGSTETSAAASSAPAETAGEAPEAPPAEEPAEAPAEAPAEEPAEEASVVEESKGDSFEAMAQEFISYPLEGDNTITMWYYIPLPWRPTSPWRRTRRSPSMSRTS